MESPYLDTHLEPTKDAQSFLLLKGPMRKAVGQNKGVQLEVQELEASSCDWKRIPFWARCQYAGPSSGEEEWLCCGSTVKAKSKGSHWSSSLWQSKALQQSCFEMEARLNNATRIPILSTKANDQHKPRKDMLITANHTISPANHYPGARLDEKPDPRQHKRGVFHCQRAYKMRVMNPFVARAPKSHNIHQLATQVQVEECEGTHGTSEPGSPTRSIFMMIGRMLQTRRRKSRRAAASIRPVWGLLRRKHNICSVRLKPEQSQKVML